MIPSNERFRLSHADSLYTYSIVDSFLKIVSDLIKQDKLEAEQFEMCFVNGFPSRRVIEALHLQAVVRYAGSFASYAETLNELKKSSAILFIQRAEGRGVIPDRFFKLLTLKRPLLALVPNIENYQHVLHARQDVYLADLRDVSSTTAAFLRMYHDWQRAVLFRGPGVGRFTPEAARSVSQKF